MLSQTGANGKWNQPPHYFTHSISSIFSVEPPPSLQVQVNQQLPPLQYLWIQQPPHYRLSHHPKLQYLHHQPWIQDLVMGGGGGGAVLPEGWHCNKGATGEHCMLFHLGLGWSPICFATFEPFKSQNSIIACRCQYDKNYLLPQEAGTATCGMPLHVRNVRLMDYIFVRSLSGRNSMAIHSHQLDDENWCSNRPMDAHNRWYSITRSTYSNVDSA